MIKNTSTQTRSQSAWWKEKSGFISSHFKCTVSPNTNLLATWSDVFLPTTLFAYIIFILYTLYVAIKKRRAEHKLYFAEWEIKLFSAVGQSLRCQSSPAKFQCHNFMCGFCLQISNFCTCDCKDACACAQLAPGLSKTQPEVRQLNSIHQTRVKGFQRHRSYYKNHQTAGEGHLVPQLMLLNWFWHPEAMYGVPVPPTALARRGNFALGRIWKVLFGEKHHQTRGMWGKY